MRSNKITLLLLAFLILLQFACAQTKSTSTNPNGGTPAANDEGPAPEPGKPQIPVWKVEREWSNEEEDLFSAWVKKEWTPDFFVSRTRHGKPNIYYGLRTDCADATMFMRVIYSYERRLPFKMINYTAVTASEGRFITNDMNRWGDLPEEKRIYEFLKLVGDITSTTAMPNETYPVSVSKIGSRAGGVALRWPNNGYASHTMQIISVDKFGELHTQNSTVPRRLRKMYHDIGWEGSTESSPHDGYRYWRPIEFVGRNVSDVPGFSLEQYGMKSQDFVAVFKKAEMTVNEKFSRQIEIICNALQRRVSAVNESLQRQKEIGKKCMSEADYEDFSTPSRDLGIKTRLTNLVNLYRNTPTAKTELPPETSSMLEALDAAATATTPVSGHESVCAVSYRKGETVGLPEIYRRYMLRITSSDPNESFEARWGELQTLPPERCK